MSDYDGRPPESQNGEGEREGEKVPGGKIAWFSKRNFSTNKTLRPIGWLERWLVYGNDDGLIRLCEDDPF